MLLHPHCAGQVGACPPWGLQGNVFWRDSAVQDIFLPMVVRKQERRWSKYGQKFLLLTHHATREEGRSLTHLWSVLQTTRKTIHFSQTRPGHQKPPCLQPSAKPRSTRRGGEPWVPTTVPFQQGLGGQTPSSSLNEIKFN